MNLRTVRSLEEKIEITLSCPLLLPTEREFYLDSLVFLSTLEEHLSQKEPSHAV